MFFYVTIFISTEDGIAEKLLLLKINCYLQPTDYHDVANLSTCHEVLTKFFSLDSFLYILSKNHSFHIVTFIQGKFTSILICSYWIYVACTYCCE